MKWRIKFQLYCENTKLQSYVECSTKSFIGSSGISTLPATIKITHSKKGLKLVPSSIFYNCFSYRPNLRFYKIGLDMIKPQMVSLGSPKLTTARDCPMCGLQLNWISRLGLLRGNSSCHTRIFNCHMIFVTHFEQFFCLKPCLFPIRAVKLMTRVHDNTRVYLVYQQHPNNNQIHGC